jgi:hypothetical protein
MKVERWVRDLKSSPVIGAQMQNNIHFLMEQYMVHLFLTMPQT